MNINPPARASPPDYGIDAPGVRRAMSFTGFIGLIVAIAPPLIWNSSRVATWISAIGFVAAAYGTFMASYMTYGSRIGKLRSRQNLLDLAATLRPWTGDENVLDVGCGRGLMLLGAARRLTTGQAVGIDLWRDEDQAENSPAALEANARLEGVADKIRIDTGDARQLPYPDASFDVVLSHWVIHNIAEPADRRKALDEMLRVLRSHGVLVLADIANISEYRTYLASKGVTDIRTVSGGAEAVIMGALSGGSYRPQALLALSP
jgi:SAM-dependent methyltransferase